MSCHSPSIRRNFGARPIRSKPFFSRTRCERTLCTSVFAPTRCRFRVRKEIVTTASTAMVATPLPPADSATQ